MYKDFDEKQTNQRKKSVLESAESFNETGFQDFPTKNALANVFENFNPENLGALIVPLRMLGTSIIINEFEPNDIIESGIVEKLLQFIIEFNHSEDPVLYEIYEVSMQIINSILHKKNIEFIRYFTELGGLDRLIGDLKSYDYKYINMCLGSISDIIATSREFIVPIVNSLDVDTMNTILLPNRFSNPETYLYASNVFYVILKNFPTFLTEQYIEEIVNNVPLEEMENVFPFYYDVFSKMIMESGYEAELNDYGLILFRLMCNQPTIIWFQRFVEDEKLQNMIFLRCKSNHVRTKQHALELVHKLIFQGVEFKDFPINVFVDCLGYDEDEEENIVVLRTCDVLSLIFEKHNETIGIAMDCGFLDMLLKAFEGANSNTKEGLLKLVNTFIRGSTNEILFAYISSGLHDSIIELIDQSKSNSLILYTVKSTHLLFDKFGGDFMEQISESSIDILRDLTDHDNEYIAEEARSLCEALFPSDSD